MKIYKWIRVGANVISITAGNNAFVNVKIAPEGTVSKFVVRQASGTAVAFEADLLDSQLLVEGVHNTALPSNVELYKVFPTKSASSGATIAEYTTGELGYSYRNQDGSHTVPSRSLWLHIRPTSAATTTTWEVAIVVDNEMG